MHKKAVGQTVEREKGRSWDVEGHTKVDFVRRPYKSMSFTTAQLADEQQSTHVHHGDRKKLASPTKPRRSTATSSAQKPIKREVKVLEQKKKVEMTDAATQTTNDAATQTSDDDERENKRKWVETKIVQTANATTSMGDISAELSAHFKNLNIGVQTMSSSERNKTPENIFTDLNDLEAEIAKIRYKALSLSESFKWLEREKTSNLRPTRPVGEDEDMIPTRDTESMFGFLPVGAEVKTPTHTKIGGKRTLSVPIVMTTPINFENPTNSPRRPTGPDTTKSIQIPESSAFFKPVPSKISHFRKHSKSLNDLPELIISYQENRAVVEGSQSTPKVRPKDKDNNSK